MKSKLEEELNRYLDSKIEFPPYYKSMKHILSSILFADQLQEIIAGLEKEDISSAKSFKLYLDTVIINMHTKIAKYKHSTYLDDERVKDIENQGYVIPFFTNETNETFVLLGIFKKEDN